MGGQDSVDDTVQIPVAVDGAGSSSESQQQAGVFESFKDKFESAKDLVRELGSPTTTVDGGAASSSDSQNQQGMFKSFQGQFESVKDRAMELGVNDIPYVTEAQTKAKEGIETAKEQTKKWAQFGVTHAGYAKDNAKEKFDEGMEFVVQPIKDAKDSVNKLVRVEPEWMAVGLGVTLALMATRKGPRRMIRNGLLGTGAGIGGLYALSASEGGK